MDTVPLHEHGKLGAPGRKLRLWFCLLAACVSSCFLPRSTACAFDSASDLPGFPCLSYNSSLPMFELACSFDWSSSHPDCILLKSNEVFEGHGHEINITGYNNWEGLFQIDIDSATGLENAPVIRNVHIIGGETSGEGGFIVQAEQNHFIVNSCTTSGEIKGDGGGICGGACSGDLLITNCSSSGDIQGEHAGGIAGSEVGRNGNRSTVKITHCHSTGNIAGNQGSGGICGWGAGGDYGSVTIAHSYSTGKIEGDRSGGICGRRAGRFHGKVAITCSYSTGDIVGSQSGGICGQTPALMNREVTIERCYSLGEIHGPRSGGIIGAHAAHRKGHVSIINCYSLGDISGSDHAGGICGSDTGFSNSEDDGGTVILTNVYASGDVTNDDAGCFIGEIDIAVKEINITMSVCNGTTDGMIGEHKGAYASERNSGTLNDIIGTVYCYYDEQEDPKECWDDETTWIAVEDDFPNPNPNPPVR